MNQPIEPAPRPIASVLAEAAKAEGQLSKLAADHQEKLDALVEKFRAKRAKLISEVSPEALKVLRDVGGLADEEEEL